MQKKISLKESERQYTLTVARKDDQVTLSGEVDGTELEISAATVDEEPPWILVRANGRTHHCAVARDGDGVWVGLKGRTYYIQRVGAKTAATGSAEGSSNEVRAPMTGTILSVHVEPGKAVARGDLMAVMEAMKMEYRLESEIDGAVASVHCKTGDMLDVGTVLIRLEPAAE